MNTKDSARALLIFTFLIGGIFAGVSAYTKTETILSYTVDSEKQELKLYWKDDNATAFKSIFNLKTWLDSKQKILIFAMNAGMYKKDNSPQGLYVENKITLAPLDTANGKGNFYLKPNGIFYITLDKKAGISTTEDFKSKKTYSTLLSQDLCCW